MKKCYTAILLLGLSPAYAATELNMALENTRHACADISSELTDMKRMAGIGTAVTAVGTVAGGVGLGTGVAKAKVDEDIADWRQKLQSMIQQEQDNNTTFTPITNDALEAAIAELQTGAEDAKELKAELDAAEQKSKTLGNVRTGTLATNTVANIAGAAISGSNRVKGDLQAQIDSCVASVDNLSRALGQARVSGADSDRDIKRAQNVVSECGQWGTVNLAGINKRAGGAAASSGIGAGVGLAGTITSALANSQQAGDEKGKGLNTAANIMAGGATVASATASIFSATQIIAIKRAASVADKCEEALR